MTSCLRKVESLILLRIVGILLIVTNFLAQRSSRLERELTLHSSSSENIIRSWQVRYHSLRESYLSLRRNIEELRCQHQEEVEEMGREHSRAYWNVNNSVLTINFYWERMMTRNIQLQAMYNCLDAMLVQRSRHFGFPYESHRLD